MMQFPKRIADGFDIAEGSTVAISGASTEELFLADLKESGGSEDQRVDGSVTPVEFLVEAGDGADPNDDIFINEVRFIFSGNNIVFDGGTFGKGGGPLANGYTLDGVFNNGAITLASLLTALINEDMMKMPSALGANITTEFSGLNDLMVISFFLGGLRLAAGSSDFIRATVNDDFTLGTRDIGHLTATVFGNEAPPSE